MNVEIIRSKRKTLAIQICPDGRILARAPHRMKDAEIMDFVRQKSRWIHKNLEKIREQRKKMAQEPPVPQLSEQELQALADQALEILPDRVRYYARQIGVDYGRITIRNQKTRWGSCSGKGNLNFNCLLMLAPAEIQDYVAVLWHVPKQPVLGRGGKDYAGLSGTEKVAERAWTGAHEADAGGVSYLCYDWNE